MNTDKFDYRTDFNEDDTYVYLNSFGITKTSKATRDKGFWWFDNYYKATTVRVLVESKEIAKLK